MLIDGVWAEIKVGVNTCGCSRNTTPKESAPAQLRTYKCLYRGAWHLTSKEALQRPTWIPILLPRVLSGCLITK